MTSGTLRGIRGSLWLLSAGTMFGAGGAAAAQTAVSPVAAAVQSLPAADEGAELRRHLTDLAANPRSLASLIGAGRAALQIGDGQAALGFFARAEEIAPRDARVKAGMASAFVQLEQPQAALRFFAEASSLGAPEAEIAGDRGLAYDMLGNPRRAQQDYALVLQRGDDPETRRRMALSLAISGHRQAALSALDPLLRRHDRSAQRVRAFVLALTGDAAGAARAVDAAMPGQGPAMAPFLARLAGLSPAQKAMAVHFGRFPANGQPVRMAGAVDTSAHPAALALTDASRPDRGQTTLGRPAQPRGRADQPGVRRRTAAAQPAATAPRRRPGPAEIETSDRIGPGSRSPARRTAAPPPRPQPQPQQQTRAAAAPPPAATAPTRRRAVETARNDAGPPPVRPRQEQPSIQEQAPAPQPGFAAPAAARPTVPATSPEQQPVRTADVLPIELPASAVDDRVLGSPAVAAPAAPAPPQPAPSAEAPAFADIAALVQSLPSEEAAAAPAATPVRRPVARPPAPTPATTTPARTAASRTGSQSSRAAAANAARPGAANARSEPARPAHPSRHWVQLAGGNRAAFQHELGRIRQAAPELLRGRTAYWAANGNSNRLLVGPFATSAEARAFVNQLAREQVQSFPWTSQAGEEVERLPAR